MISLARSFFRDLKGTTLVTFAVLSPVVLGGAALGVEAATWYTAQAKLRAIADQTALSAAKELTLANRDITIVSAAAKSFAMSQVVTAEQSATVVNTEVFANKAGVKVTITRTMQPLFGNILPRSNDTISVVAIAKVSGKANVCMIGFEQSAPLVITLNKSATLTADRCAIYSNSTSTSGLTIADQAKVTASLICSSGGYKPSGTPLVTPQPTTDCPKLTDPLAGRTEPASLACDTTNLVVSGETRTLMPGTYCGGLTMKGAAKVTLSPGIYIMKDGKFSIDEFASVIGTNVSIFFLDGKTGLFSKSTMNAAKNSTIELTAPNSGPMAGILFSEARANRTTIHNIRSDNAAVLLGTIYFPVSVLLIDGDKPVSQRSAYTVIVARAINIDAGPNLYLNADYSLTDVPVPKGLGPVGGSISLSQ